MNFLSQSEADKTRILARCRDDVLLIDLRESALSFIAVIAGALSLYVFPGDDISVVVNRDDPRAPFRACVGFDAFARAAPLWTGLAAAPAAAPVYVLGAWWSSEECRALTIAAALLRETLEA